MCDTIGRIKSPKYAIFGKNSDRAVNEPQVVEFYKAQDYKEGSKVKCTYIEIEQATHTNAIVLSRPTWLWGGEIGVNEYGVCIGNEAVFTKGKYGKESLIGMDLLRLGLERGNSAKEAMDTIISLLEKYGQGGNCGYDSNFEYNNSFLIMDRNDLFVLETVNKEYVYKKYDKTAISNCLSIHDDGDTYKSEKSNFAKKYSNSLMTFGSCAIKRRNLSLSKDIDNVQDMIEVLSSHQDDCDPFVKGSVASVCMHASNSLTADQTTMSMIIELTEDDINIWLTGGSNPCISLYKPAKFKANGIIYDGLNHNNDYWYNHEEINRKFIGKKVSEEFFELRKQAQEEIYNINKKEITEESINRSLEIEKEFYKTLNDKGIIDGFINKKQSLIYKKFWGKKNKIFTGEKNA